LGMGGQLQVFGAGVRAVQQQAEAGRQGESEHWWGAEEGCVRWPSSRAPLASYDGAWRWSNAVVRGVSGKCGCSCGDGVRGCGDGDRGCGERERGCGERERGCGERDRGCGDSERGCWPADPCGDCSRVDGCVCSDMVWRWSPSGGVVARAPLRWIRRGARCAGAVAAGDRGDPLEM